MLKKSTIIYITILFLAVLLPLKIFDAQLFKTTLFGIRIDYIIHGFIFAPWMWLIPFSKSKKSIVLWFSIGIAVAFLIEWAQIIIPNRNFNVWDLVCNLIGLTVSMLTFVVWRYKKRKRVSERIRLAKLREDNANRDRTDPTDQKDIIVEKIGAEAFSTLSEYVDMEAATTSVIFTTNPFNISNISNQVKTIVNLRRVNGIRFINKFFETINKKLSAEDKFICCVETIQGRRKRQKINRIPIIRSLYYAVEFFSLRAAPKIWGIKKVYFFVTKGRRRLLSKAEVLGRLVCCGFEIIDYKNSNGLTYIIVKKIKAPSFDLNPSYSALYKMPRVGKDGKIIKVYKMRTMHPYAEYLQGYLVEKHGYAESGKPANDFRLTPWGKVMRRYWMDEIPQLINLIKGDLKLVGVRPVSAKYFEGIPEDLQKLRLAQKPGCIPPYVALNRKGNVKDVLQAEREYLEEKIKKPYFTDTKFFFRAIFNIIFRRKRSA